VFRVGTDPAPVPGGHVGSLLEEADLKRLRLVRGLSNDSGFNNCFLNVVIQSLWHLRPFREALLGLPPQARAAG